MVIHDGIPFCPFLPFSQRGADNPPAQALEAFYVLESGPEEKKSEARKVIKDYIANDTWTVYGGTDPRDANLWIHCRLYARLAWPIIEGGKLVYHKVKRTQQLERMRGSKMLDVDLPLYHLESNREALEEIVGDTDLGQTEKEWLAPLTAYAHPLVEMSQAEDKSEEEFIEGLESLLAKLDGNEIELDTSVLENALYQSSIKAFDAGVAYRKHLETCKFHLADDMEKVIDGSAKERNLFNKLFGKVKREIRDEGPDTLYGILATLIEDLATTEQRPPTKKELREAYNDETGNSHKESWLTAPLKKLKLSWLLQS